MVNQIYFDEVKVGDMLPKLEKTPTAVQLFRYSAVRWIAHRIHYDKDYAQREGYPDIIVQSSLHIAFLTQLCTDWMGAKGELKSLDVNVKRFSILGDTLTCRGEIVGKNDLDGNYFVIVKLEEINQKGEICAPGKAVIKLPLSGESPIN